MSSKQSNNMHWVKDKKNRPVLIAAVIAVLVLPAVLIWALMPGKDASQAPEEQTQPSAESNTLQTETAAAEPEEPCLFNLGGGIKVMGLIDYTGAFMEDRTDEVVTDVLGIQVKNTGEDYIQTMDITLYAGDTQAQFSLSTLFPGETVIVLEKNRMAYSTAPEFESAQSSMVALFSDPPGMCQDKLEIQCLNGVINITNISGEDIPGDIFVYYKNYVAGMYYGGITYRIRIQGGMKADQIHQGTAAHFNPSNSTVVFVTCGS